MKEINFENPFFMKLTQHYCFNNQIKCNHKQRRRKISLTISKDDINDMRKGIKDKYLSEKEEELICVT